LSTVSGVLQQHGIYLTFISKQQRGF